MEERIKLERIDIRPKKYSTGEAQEWTYEYTWEDFEAALEYPLFEEWTSVRPNSWFQINSYFKEHPEKLYENGVYKGSSCYAEEASDLQNSPLND